MTTATLAYVVDGWRNGVWHYFPCDVCRGSATKLYVLDDGTRICLACWGKRK